MRHGATKVGLLPRNACEHLALCVDTGRRLCTATPARRSSYGSLAALRAGAQTRLAIAIGSGWRGSRVWSDASRRARATAARAIVSEI